MSAEQLSAIAGIILSLAFSYVPKLNDWYSTLAGTSKRLVMAAALLIVAGASLWLSCANLIVSVACTQAGLFSLINAFVMALVANQATYMITPMKKVK